MFNGIRNKSITVLVHVLVWGLLIFVLFMYPPLAGANAKLPKEFWVKQLIHTILMVSVFYLNAAYLVPNLLLKDKLIAFIGSIIFLGLVSSMLLARVDVWFNLSKELERAFGKKMWHNSLLDFFGLMTVFMVLGISTSVTLIQYQQRDLTIRQEFESQRTLAELSFLKAQINPHFFFNTLNSIYALTYVNVETSRQVLYKLSRMMRYLLYETQQNITLLSKEVAFIQDYIEIMKLRLSSNTIVHFNLPEKINEMPVAPMMLLPYVENAFKHGVDDQKTSTILIDIEQQADGITLYVINNIVPRSGSAENKIDEKGIGLVNTKRRLDLLYKDKYSLSAVKNKQSGKYEVHLKLILT